MKTTLMKYVSVGIGGMIGSSLRYAIGTWIEVKAFLFPWETFAVNITGAFMLSFLLFLPLTKENISPLIFPGITTGILGAYTTFSTLMLEAVQLMERHFLLAMIYLALSFIAGLVSSFAGYKFVHIFPDRGGARF